MSKSCGGACGGDATSAADTDIQASSEAPGRWVSVYAVPKMDCPSEERMIRLALNGFEEIRALSFDLSNRRLKVVHDGEVEPVTSKLKTLGLGASLQETVAANPETIKAADVAMPTHSEAIQAVLNALVDKDNGVIGSMQEIDAVGHRVVHGGEAFAGSVLITDEVMKALEECIPLAPLHNPANITGINACTAVMGKDVPQVAVFDTAFHQTMPAKAYMYALPYEYYEKDKVRRYGFHGTSHKYVSGRAAAMLGKKPEELKLISCHLGNGSSIAAVDGGKSVDTSMGFTPLAGLPMGTRAGDLDAGILQYLMNKYGMSIDEMLNILNKKSGVEGLSGVSSDFRDLEKAAEEGNARAQLAEEKFAYEVKKYVGAYAAAMGGVDAIIFTAGVGENCDKMRRMIFTGLQPLGMILDEEKNRQRGFEREISTESSPVKIIIIPTNEEYMIARDTYEILHEKVDVPLV